jgi:hypothetical protein
MKLQLVIPILMLIGGLTLARLRSGWAGLREPFRLAAGLAIGGLVLAALPLPALGIQGYRDWLLDLHQFNLNLANPNGINYAPHLIGSLPEVLSTSGGDQGRLLGWAVSVGSALATMGALVGIARRQPDVQRDTMMALAVFALVFVAPYLRIYDSCVLILPLWITLFKLPEGSRTRRVGLAALGPMWLLLDGLFLRIWFGFSASG